ncbi:MAG: hypothetical protein ACYC5N_01610, partial [Endomicrobiales bacterium]
MRKAVCAFFAFIVPLSLVACGDNKTKAKLVGTEVVSASTIVPPVPQTPAGAVAVVAARSADLAASVASVGIKTSLSFASKQEGVRREVSFIDNEGFWNLGVLSPGMNGLYMRF